MNRRIWLLSGLAAGGAMLVGWSVLPPRNRLGSPALLASPGDAVALNGWLKLDRDGNVLLAMNRSEMGQGVHTALAMLVADELDVPLHRVRLIPAGHDAIYGNVAAFVAGMLSGEAREPGQQGLTVRLRRHLATKLSREIGINLTGGSSSVADAWDVLRLAAATARSQLLNAAALEWRLPVSEFSVVDGVIRHRSGQNAPYQAFAQVAPITPTGSVELKHRSQWKLIGTPAPRTDAAIKANGRAVFGIDERQPGQLFAVVSHAPMFGGSPGAIDADAALRRPGVVRVVRLGPIAGAPPAIAVVGISHWHALRGAQALAIEWQAPTIGKPDSQEILRTLEFSAVGAAASGEGQVWLDRGDVDSVAATGARRLLAIYRTPYLAHAALEPVNATARVANGRVEVWAPTQVPGLARALAARVAGVDESAVRLHVSFLGGGFGRRLDTEVVGQAVRVAMDCGGAPVQLIWPREEDFRHDVYRPATVAVMQADLDADGMPMAVRMTSAGDAITPRWIERNLPALATRFELPDQTSSKGLINSPYEIAHHRVTHVATRSGIPVGYWRSVGHSHNAFFNECFIDELAAAAGDDPVQYRLTLLSQAPRHAAVLRLAADRAGWPGIGTAQRKLPSGHALGVALHESYGSIVAQVAEVSLQDKLPRVHRVVVAADIGTVVNPEIVAQQFEGGVIFGLSAALFGRIDVVDGVVQQRNFPEHPLLGLAATPVIETHLIASERPPAGVGEIATPPIAPAVANALFVLTGRRIRDLPLA
ncbi:molybdopterin cofactor-binding domain-containing protein [Piscinibacter sakaiensis]|uniref:xanthine dehydrogenase family protein molybdopterin-binding subunit n=1 Tax=Piscinibacter sakaiensis TaxID=1547922 RepID=UPI003AB00C1D